MAAKKLVPLQTGTFKSFDGTSIYYESRGTGEPLVFVYGIACLINHWHHQIEELSHHYRVITFDLRGHHRSGIPNEASGLSMEALGRDLAYLTRELGLKRAHFVGHSFGAQVILSAYSQSPAIFSSISFINGFAKNPIKGMFGLDVVEPFFYWVKSQYEKNSTLIDQLWALAIDNPISMIGSALAGGFNLKLTEFKDIEIYTRGVSQIPLRVFIPYFEDMMRFRGDLIATQIQVPTLVISGDRDFVTPLKFQEELHQSIPNSEFVVVPYGSHCTQLDFPDYVNLKLKSFLQGLKKQIEG